MQTQRSFTKFERQLEPSYRTRINAAESTEDVRKFFVETALDLLEATLDGVETTPKDVAFDPGTEDGYLISERLKNNGKFRSTFNNSDLAHILKRFAGLAARRYAHLETNPDKTESKMYPRPGRR